MTDHQTRNHGSDQTSEVTHIDGKPVTFSITQLAEEFGLTTRAIRFYEDKGLLTPERQGQTRIYHPRDRARLTLIVRGKNVGLALAEIKEILGLYDLPDGGETQNRVAIDKFRRRIESLARQRDEIDLQIETLTAGCAYLENQLAGRIAQGNLASQTPEPHKRPKTAASKTAASKMSKVSGESTPQINA